MGFFVKFPFFMAASWNTGYLDSWPVSRRLRFDWIGENKAPER